MADTVPLLDQMAAAADDREIVFNGVVDALSPSSLYGRNYETTTGLTWGYIGGFFNNVDVPNGTVTATASNTNYVVAHRTTAAVSISTSTTNWNDTTTYMRLWQLTAGGSAITAWLDKRQAFGAAAPSLGGGTAGALDYDTDGTLAANSDAKIATQKATKTYVDASLAGLSWKQAVRVATTANGTLSTAFENGDTVDGVTLATGNRILIKNQSSATENGIYVVAASGSPTRATDADSGAELVNASVFVSEGTANADTQWVCTTNATITIGATSITFVQFATTPAATAREIQLSCSDLTTALTTGTNKAYARAPRAMTITGVRASLLTAQASGSIFTVDINEAGTTILSTKLTIDNTENTSTTAATAAVVSDASIADDAEITIDIDQIGNGTAKGLIVAILYT